MSAANFNAYPFGVVHDNHTWTQPTFRATLSQQFNPDIFGYLTYSHGFRAGGYNDQVGTSGAPITDDEKKPTNPEKADSFEVGLKSELWDRRIRLNEAVFYVQYKDAIRQVVVPVTNANGQPGEETLFRNAAKFTVYGIESELTAELAPGLLAAPAAVLPALQVQPVHQRRPAERGRPVGTGSEPLPGVDRDRGPKLHPAAA